MSIEILTLVKNKIGFLSRDNLYSIAASMGIEANKRAARGDLLDKVHDSLNEENADIIIRGHKNAFGFTSGEVEDKLQITNRERRKWTDKGLLYISGYYKARAYGKYLQCPVYDPEQILALKPETIEEWRKGCKQLTAAQTEGIKKSQETRIKNRTCRSCSSIVRNKKELRDGLCTNCQCREKARAERKKWLDNKSEYVILDTETTGLDSDDEIIEISIIDLDGKTLISSLVMPTKEISPEAYDTHGISLETLTAAKAPSWSKIYKQVKAAIKGKIIIAYGAEFDERMLDQTSERYGLLPIDSEYVCLMMNVMREYNSKRYISLRAASGEYQSHRAEDDCRLCLEIIRDCKAI